MVLFSSVLKSTESSMHNFPLFGENRKNLFLNKEWNFFEKI